MRKISKHQPKTVGEESFGNSFKWKQFKHLLWFPCLFFVVLWLNTAFLRVSVYFFEIFFSTPCSPTLKKLYFRLGLQYRNNKNHKEKGLFLNPATEDSRNVRVTQKIARCDTCVRVILYFLFCFTRQISYVSCLKPSHSRSGTYARNKGFPCVIMDKIIVRENKWIAKRVWLIFVLSLARSFFLWVSRISHVFLISQMSHKSSVASFIIPILIQLFSFLCVMGA